MILVIDNYDSFTYNLVQYIGALGAEPVVRFNDQVSATDVSHMNPKGIVIGSGAGAAQDAGRCVELLRALAGRVPIFGVGLGHQCIAVAFGGTVAQGRHPVHGKSETVVHDRKGLFARLHLPFVAARYDAALVDEVNLPPDLQVTARFESGAIAGLRHATRAVEAVQFDPASILTVNGQHIIQNFLAMTNSVRAA